MERECALCHFAKYYYLDYDGSRSSEVKGHSADRNGWLSADLLESDIVSYTIFEIFGIKALPYSRNSENALPVWRT